MLDENRKKKVNKYSFLNRNNLQENPISRILAVVIALKNAMFR